MKEKDCHPGRVRQEEGAAQAPMVGRSYRRVVSGELAAMQEKLDEARYMLRRKEQEFATLQENYFDLECAYRELKVERAQLADRYDDLSNSYNMALAMLQCVERRVTFAAVIHHHGDDSAVVNQLTRQLERYREELRLQDVRLEEQERENANLRFIIGDAETWLKERLCRVLTASIRQLMDERDAAGNHVMGFGRQWWAIYRVLVDEYGFPEGYTEFCSLMDGMGLGEGSAVRLPCKMESLKKISFPFDRKITDWDSLSGESDISIRRQYIVATALHRIIEANLAA